MSNASNDERAAARNQYVDSYVNQIIERIEHDWLPGMAMTVDFTDREINTMIIAALERVGARVAQLKTDYIEDILPEFDTDDDAEFDKNWWEEHERSRIRDRW